MNFNIRFIVTLILLVLLIISLALICFEIYRLTEKPEFELKGIKTDWVKLNVGEEVKIKKKGFIIINSSMYKNIGAFIHVVTILCGVYLVYSN